MRTIAILALGLAACGGTGPHVEQFDEPCLGATAEVDIATTNPPVTPVLSVHVLDATAYVTTGGNEVGVPAKINGVLVSATCPTGADAVHFEVTVDWRPYVEDNGPN